MSWQKRHGVFALTAKACLLALAWLVLPVLLLQTLPITLPLVPPLISERTVKARFVTCVVPVVGRMTVLLSDIVVHHVTYNVRPLTWTQWKFSNLRCDVSMTWTTTDASLPIVSGTLSAAVSTGSVVPFRESASVHVDALHVECLGYDVDKYLSDSLVRKMVREDLDKVFDCLNTIRTSNAIPSSTKLAEDGLSRVIVGCYIVFGIIAATIIPTM